MVALVYKDRLANLLEHELVFRVLESRFCYVAGVFVADESVQQHIV